MPQYKIKYSGLDSMDTKEWEIIEAKDLEAAGMHAWEEACNDLDGYGGLHGTPSVESIMEEAEENGEEMSDDEAWEQFKEERESWLNYVAQPLAEGETAENVND